MSVHLNTKNYNYKLIQDSLPEQTQKFSELTSTFSKLLRQDNPSMEDIGDVLHSATELSDQLSSMNISGVDQLTSKVKILKHELIELIEKNENRYKQSVISERNNSYDIRALLANVDAIDAHMIERLLKKSFQGQLSAEFSVYDFMQLETFLEQPNNKVSLELIRLMT